jgi:hypothetical protein
MQRRQHLRVRLRLPVRLRWSAPLGQRTEQSETINASRGGLLLVSKETHAVGHRLWVTFPFDPVASGPQPELLARVVRSTEDPSAKEAARWNVALHFERAAQMSSHSGNGRLGRTEKTNGAGRSIALPIRVRPRDVPWHEEAMTLEVSTEELKFLTHREYAFGERLLVTFASPADAPWSGDTEWETEVTGIQTEAGSDSLRVTVSKKRA